MAARPRWSKRCLDWRQAVVFPAPEVVIVDSPTRRAIDGDLDVQSLTPVTHPKERRDT